MKIRLEGAELFHAGGWIERERDMTKLIVTFRNFVDPPKSVVRTGMCMWKFTGKYSGRSVM